MTKSNRDKLADKIANAQGGYHPIQYAEDTLTWRPVAERWKFDRHAMFHALLRKWPNADTPICALSFVFTDAPYHLSRFVFDAVVVWDGNEFRRVEFVDLPAPFQAALRMFEETVELAILTRVGDAVAAMSDQYSHRLLSGQGYLTLETLTVINIRGENMSGIDELTPTLPYAIYSSLSGRFCDIVSRDPESTKPGGVFPFTQWIIDNWERSRVSERHLASCFERSISATASHPDELTRFQQAVKALHDQAGMESSGVC